MTLTKTLSPAGVLIAVNGNDIRQPQVIEDIVDEVASASGSIIGPFAIAATPVNNYAPTGFASSASVITAAPTVNTQMTGLLATVDGHEVEIANRSPNGASISFVNQSTSSDAANRFLMPDEVTANWVLPMDASVKFRYDGAASRWKMISWLATTTPKLVVTTFGASLANIDTLYVNGSEHKLVVDELEIHGQGQGQVAIYSLAAGDNDNFKFGDATGNKLAAWFWGTLTAPSAAAVTGIDSTAIGAYTASTLGRTGYFYIAHDSVNSVTFKHNVTSAAGNRLFLPNGADLVVRKGGCIGFRRVNVNGIDGWVCQSVSA